MIYYGIGQDFSPTVKRRYFLLMKLMYYYLYFFNFRVWSTHLVQVCFLRIKRFDINVLQDLNHFVNSEKRGKYIHA